MRYKYKNLIYRIYYKDKLSNLCVDWTNAQFVEKSDHILVTKDYYFNGCESANVIYLNYAIDVGIRNRVLRGVQNIIYVQVTGGHDLRINGMKEDNRFLMWEWEWVCDWLILK